MTREQYHAIVEDYDDHRLKLAISRIPKNINPTGNVFKKRLQAIRESL